MNAISIRHLSKSYGSFEAVRDVTIDIPKGCVFGLLGPNGSGKTTTFKCLLGLARPTSGDVLFDGTPLSPDRFERMAYVPERSALYECMRVRDFLETQRRFYTHYDAARAKELLDVFGLDPGKRVRSMSKGMRTALQVVLAFSIRPDILVLDEPTSGLDPVNQRVVLNLIIDASATGTTVLFSSHQIGQVERAAERVAVLQSGSIVLSGAVDDLKDQQKIVEGIFPDETYAVDTFAADPRIARVDKSGRILRLTVRDGADEIASRVTAMNAIAVRVVDLNLEDMFLNAVGASNTADVLEHV
ncbi:MAG: ABC transporter ATP-binding protein [Candidatus Eremiobacteraeota bacterium]|nr:ABC transporter ATP-binding protein [Candidatus Eremiobacteraeota bacterium]